MIVFCIIVSVILILLFSPFEILISLDNSDTVIKLKLAGITLYTKQKKFLDYFKSSEEKVYKIKEKSLSLEKNYKLQYEFWKSVLKLINKYLSIKNIKIGINFGTSDAATTAICTGVLWGAVYRILGIIGLIIPIESNYVNVTPEYNRDSFSIKGECIIKGTIVYIIIIVIALMIKNPNKKKRRKK